MRSVIRQPRVSIPFRAGPVDTPIPQTDLRARYESVGGSGWIVFASAGKPANEVDSRFFDTDPPTTRPESGDHVAAMHRETETFGGRCRGRSESFVAAGHSARIVRGCDAPTLQCARKR